MTNDFVVLVWPNQFFTYHLWNIHMRHQEFTLFLAQNIQLCELDHVKSKVFLLIILWWTIGHWILLVLLFGIYSRSGFGDDWISQVNLQEITVILCVRSDRAVYAGQTGGDRAVGPASPRSDRPTLCQFLFRVVYFDIRVYFIIMTSRWILYVCNTIVCC